MDWNEIVLVLGAGCAATVLAVRGYRKKSLSKSGAAAAFGVGFVSLSTLPRSGIAMLAFYLSGSSLTKVGAMEKKKLDKDYKIGGQRGAVQVLSCSLLATCLSAVHYAQVGSDVATFSDESSSLHKCLLLGIGAHFATCAADTWASELGVLSTTYPVLVTNLRRVPPGTNGAVSRSGLVASILGGGFIGLVMWLTSSKPFMQDWQMVPFCMFFGLAGSLLDSLLGATLQLTVYDNQSQQIVSSKEKDSPNTKIICGRDILDNQQVNQVSVLMMTAFGCLIGFLL